MPASLLHWEDGVRGPGCAGLEGRLNLRRIVALVPVALRVRVTRSHQKGTSDALQVRVGVGVGLKRVRTEQPHLTWNSHIAKGKKSHAPFCGKKKGPNERVIHSHSCLYLPMETLERFTII